MHLIQSIVRDMVAVNSWNWTEMSFFTCLSSSSLIYASVLTSFSHSRHSNCAHHERQPRFVNLVGKEEESLSGRHMTYRHLCRDMFSLLTSEMADVP